MTTGRINQVSIVTRLQPGYEAKPPPRCNKRSARCIGDETKVYQYLIGLTSVRSRQLGCCAQTEGISNETVNGLPKSHETQCKLE